MQIQLISTRKESCLPVEGLVAPFFISISRKWSKSQVYGLVCKFRLGFEPRTDTGGEVQIDIHLEFSGYSRFQVIIQADR
jgi:hypothetical protein